MAEAKRKALARPACSIFPRREPEDMEIWTISARFLRMLRARVEEITGDANDAGYEDILLCAEKCLVEYEEEKLSEAEYQLEEDERQMSAISSQNAERRCGEATRRYLPRLVGLQPQPKTEIIMTNQKMQTYEQLFGKPEETPQWVKELPVLSDLSDQTIETAEQPDQSEIIENVLRQLTSTILHPENQAALRAKGFAVLIDIADKSREVLLANAKPQPASRETYESKRSSELLSDYFRDKLQIARMLGVPPNHSRIIDEITRLQSNA